MAECHMIEDVEIISRIFDMFNEKEKCTSGSSLSIPTHNLNFFYIILYICESRRQEAGSRTRRMSVLVHVALLWNFLTL